jgi:uronate dehydrogenase
VSSTTPPPLNHLLLTGAAGMLGRVLRQPLRGACQRLTLSDLSAPLAAALGQPGSVPCDLADASAVHTLLQGVDAIVHLGGVAVEGPFEPILQANIRGIHNLYEAARRQGVRRIVFASSNHVTGCYEQGRRTLPQEPPRPDGNYGLSKLFGEGMASLYWDRYGIESVCLRIGTATPDDRPPDRRALATWLSHADLVRLVIAALTAPAVGFLVAYGISDNPRAWYDSREAWARIGYVPQDSAEVFAADVEHIVFPPDTPMARYQGGSFMGIGPFDQA